MAEDVLAQLDRIEAGIAELLARTSDLPPSENVQWPHDDDWSPPDEDGFVSLKVVETVLIPKYGESISISRGSPSNPSPYLVVIPRKYYIREALPQITDPEVKELVQWNCDNAPHRAPFNAVFELDCENKPRVPGVPFLGFSRVCEAGDMVPDALSVFGLLKTAGPALEARAAAIQAGADNASGPTSFYDFE